MTDFDFEEIDKAVAGATNPDTDADEVQKIEPVESTPTPPAVEEALSAPEVAEAPAFAPAARRSSGRFMDVVHPSSDMRTRSGTSLDGPFATEKPQNSFTPPSVSADTTTDTDVDSDGVVELDSVVGAWSKPLESPFLADAKVEKRPLGGVGPEPTQVLLDAPEEELRLEAPDEHLLEAMLPDPIDFAAQTAAAELPDEKEDTGSLELSSEEIPEQTIEQLNELNTPVAETSELEVSETTPFESPAPLGTATEEPVGPTSITQQYTEQTSAAQTSGAIYDTENYHQPFAPAPKKRSGVWTIIWILLLVILGAGAGVAFYLFVLPML